MFTKAQVNRSVASDFSKSRIDPIYSTETKPTQTSLFPQKGITNFTKQAFPYRQLHKITKNY